MKQYGASFIDSSDVLLRTIKASRLLRDSLIDGVIDGVRLRD
jgi:hypothetical protein